jgi:hypothetical protein
MRRRRAYTIPPRLRDGETLELDAETALLLEAERPRTRGDCAGGERPCPWVGCKYHLAVEVSCAGGLKLAFPGVELEDMVETCALDVADAGGATLEQCGQLLGITRERIRQVQARALQRFARHELEEAPGHAVHHLAAAMGRTLTEEQRERMRRARATYEARHGRRRA